MFTDTVTGMLAPAAKLPLAGLTLSQPGFTAALQASVPPPGLLTTNVWLDGLEPCWAEKDKAAELTWSAGAGVRVSVTATLLDTSFAPGAESSIEPVYVPLPIPAVFSDTVIDELAPAVRLPLDELRPSQGLLAVALQFSVPSPAFVTVSVWVAALVPS